jgi:hypothetical protein
MIRVPKRQLQAARQVATNSRFAGAWEADQGNTQG